ncbi:MAG TPA: tetratricopeptide repeat protein [Lacipirellula sp.]
MGRHFERGRALFALKRYREAIAEYQQELADEPSCVASQTNIAASLLNLKKFDEAETALRDAVSIDPAYPHTYYIAARIREHQGDLPGALAAIQDGIGRAPSALFFYEYARLLFVARRLEDAFAATTSALEIDPQFERALMLRADILNYLGRADEAERLLRFLLELNPENAAVHNAAGKLSLTQRQNSAAWDFLNSAAQIDPVAHLSLNELAAAQGRQLWPISVIDRGLRKLQTWKPIRRWMFVACVSTVGIVASRLAHGRSAAAMAIVSFAFVVAANAFLIIWLPAVLDIPAAILAKLRNRRQFHYGWRECLKRDLPKAVAVLLLAVAPASVFAVYTAMSPALSFAMAIIVVNYESQFSLVPAFPKYGLLLLVVSAPLIVSVARSGSGLIFDNPIGAIALWCAVVVISAIGPLYLRTLASRRISVN